MGGTLISKRLTGLRSNLLNLVSQIFSLGSFRLDLERLEQVGSRTEKGLLIKPSRSNIG